MNKTSYLGVLASLLLPATATAQARVATLAAAQETFQAIDLNKDGKLSPAEVTTGLRIGPAETRGIDADQDGFWSRDEFLVFYRQRLTAAKVRPAADLEAEATRILAARKAKASEQLNQKKLSDARRAARTTPSLVALSDAVDELEVKASAGKATDADFARVRELLSAEARRSDQEAKGEDLSLGEKSELHQKLLQSLERLRAAAAAGTFSREEFLAFRQSLVRRLRNAADPAQPDSGQADTSAELRRIQQGLVDSLDQLEKRAVAGNATREDFDRVREQLIARARAAANETHAPGAVEQELQGPLHLKMIQSLDRLQAAAAAGTFSREEYTAFRQSVLERFRDAANGPADAPAAGQATDLPSIEKGLSDAIDQLEKRAAAGGATRADFQRVRDQMIARARAAANGAQGAVAPEADPESPVYRKLMQSLDRLEAAAQQGTFSRQEYMDLRSTMIHRAREADSPGQPRLTAATAATDEAGMNQAVDDLQKRVDGGKVAPADFQNLRQLIERKNQALAGKTDPQSAAESAAYAKLMQSLDRLAKAAQTGSVDRQEFEAFRASFVHRARQISNDAAEQKSASSSSSNSSEKSAEAQRTGSPVATPPAARPLPASGSGAGADPKPQPAPARPKPAEGKPQERPPAPQPVPQNPPQTPPQNPPHNPPQRPAGGGGGDSKPARGSGGGG